MANLYEAIMNSTLQNSGKNRRPSTAPRSTGSGTSCYAHRSGSSTNNIGQVLGNFAFEEVRVENMKRPAKKLARKTQKVKNK